MLGRPGCNFVWPTPHKRQVRGVRPGAGPERDGTIVVREASKGRVDSAEEVVAVHPLREIGDPEYVQRGPDEVARL